MSRPVPKSLSPLTREQIWWRAGTIALFVLLGMIGWYLTVAQTLVSSIERSREQLSSRLQDTTQTAVRVSAIERAWSELSNKSSRAVGATFSWFTQQKNQNVLK